jgi:hypothetical protein
MLSKASREASLRLALDTDGVVFSVSCSPSLVHFLKTSARCYEAASAIEPGKWYESCDSILLTTPNYHFWHDDISWKVTD